MSFAEIKGQDRVINILKRVIANDHMAHSYLFHGPEGVGKKMTAVSFAMAVNCAAYDGDSCGKCTSCRKISSGIHPDISVIDPESGEIKIGAIRDLINGMVYKPLEAKRRVVIVNGADRFNISSSNAFLKTLEEPPAGTVIILISSNPDMLLPTILSRCQKVSFAQIPIEIISGILMEKSGIGREQARFAAQMADGSPGKAMSLISDDIQNTRLEIIKGLFTADGQVRGGSYELSEKFSKDEASFCNALFWILTCLRDILILKENGDAGLIINKDMKDDLYGLKERVSLNRLLDMVNQVKSACKGQERNMNRQLALDVLGNKIADGISH